MTAKDPRVMVMREMAKFFFHFGIDSIKSVMEYIVIERTDAISIK